MKPTVEDLRNEIIGVMSSEKSSNEKFDRIVFLFNKSGLIEQKLLTSPSAKEPSKSADVVSFAYNKVFTGNFKTRSVFRDSEDDHYYAGFLDGSEYAQQLTPNKPCEVKCVSGCKRFTGGEIKHHKDCQYYPESFSKMYDDLKLSVSNKPVLTEEEIIKRSAEILLSIEDKGITSCDQKMRGVFEFLKLEFGLSLPYSGTLKRLIIIL